MSTPVQKTVTLKPGDNIQAAIDANPASTIFMLAAGTWHGQQFFAKNGDQFIGDPDGGTILTGDDVTPYLTYDQNNGSNQYVLFKNITVAHYNVNQPECFNGAIHGAVRWTFDHDNFVSNNCTGLTMGHDTTVIGGHYTNNAHSGLEGSYSHNSIIKGAEIARNNTRHDNPYNDASGVKFTASNNIQWINNWIHDNNSTGFWCDIHCTNVTIDGNTITNNQGSGIGYEISSGAIIRNNVVNDNLVGISITESGNNQVYNNNLRVSSPTSFGILLQASPRSDQPIKLENNSIHDNTITFTSTSGAYAGGTGFRDYNGLVGNGNSINRNTYYVLNKADLHWYWSSQEIKSWSQLRAAGQETQGALYVGNGSRSGCPKTDCSMKATIVKTKEQRIDILHIWHRARKNPPL